MRTEERLLAILSLLPATLIAAACSDEPARRSSTSPNAPPPGPVPGLPFTSAPRCVAQSADAVFWIDDRGQLGGVRKDGAAAATVLRPVEAHVTPQCTIAIDGDRLYATAFGSGTVVWMTIDAADGGLTLGREGGSIGDLSGPTALTFDDDHLFVTEGPSGRIKRVKKPGAADAGAMTVDLGGAGTDAESILLDGDTLTWLDRDGLRQMAKSGGPVSTLTTNGGVQLMRAGSRFVWLGAPHGSNPAWAIQDGGVCSVEVGGGPVSCVALAKAKDEYEAEYAESEALTAALNEAGGGPGGIPYALPVPSLSHTLGALAARGDQLFVTTERGLYRVPALPAPPADSVVPERVSSWAPELGRNPSVTLLLVDDARAFYWGVNIEPEVRPSTLPSLPLP